MEFPAKLGFSATRFMRHLSSRPSSFTLKQLGIREKVEILRKATGLTMNKTKDLIADLSRGNYVLPSSYYKCLIDTLNGRMKQPCTLEEAKAIFSLPHHALRERVEFLDSCGVGTFKPSHIIQLKELVDTVPFRVIEALMDIDSNINVLEVWINSLEDVSLQEEIRDHLRLIPSASVQSTIHVIVACCLSRKWDLSFESALSVVEKGLFGRICTLKRTTAMVEFLFREGFDKSIITDHPYVLAGDAVSAERFLTEYGSSNFLGKDARQFLRENLEFLSIMNFDDVQQNLKNLEPFKVPPSTILIEPLRLLTPNPHLQMDRLQQFASMPELFIFVHHEKFAVVLENIETVAVRVETLRTIDPRLITVSLCTCSSNRFIQLVQGPRILRIIPEELLKCLVCVTGQDIEVIRNVLRSHPYHTHISVVNVKKVTELLESEGFTPEQIFDGLILVLYPVDIVAQKLKDLERHEAVQPYDEKKKSKTILRYVLYMIESDYDFKGTGVFATHVSQQPKPEI